MQQKATPPTKLQNFPHPPIKILEKYKQFPTSLLNNRILKLIQTIRTVPLVGGWGLFEDVGDLAEIFFVGVGGTFEDGGLRDYLFAN